MSDPGAQENPMPANEQTTAVQPDAAKARTPREAGARRRSLLRVGVAVAGFAVVAAAVAIPQFVRLPEVSTAAIGETITPVPAESRLLCSGDFIDAGDPETLTAVGGTESNVWPEDSVTEVVQLEQPDFGGENSGSTVLTVPADQDESAPNPAGLTTQNVSTETLRGLTAATCAEGSADSWIVAGSTDVGNTSVLLLANPSEVPATVDLSLFGENGVIDAAGSTGITVPAETVQAYSLAGFAPDVVEPVVRVVARGGQITAALQSSAISGLDPVGVESSAAGAGPSTEVTIPGFTIVSPSAQTASDDGTGQAGSPVLRILAPGEDDATVTVRITNEDPSGSGSSTSVVVPAGRATEVPLSDLGEGSYTIALSSDQPIVAGARSVSTGEAGTDYAWFASTTAQSGDFAVANTAVAPATLHLLNAGQETASITVSTPGGDDTLEVGPQTAVTVDIGTETAVVSSDRELHASVSLADGGRIAAYPVVPPSPLAAALTVYDH